MDCPKCGYAEDGNFAECPVCGIIIAKVRQQKEAEKELKKGLRADRLKMVTSLHVRQQVEMSEMVTGFEAPNRYLLLDQDEKQLYTAVEERKSFLLRNWLQSLRPFSICVSSPVSGDLLWAERPFRFYFHELDIYSHDQILLGRVERNFALMNRAFEVKDFNGRPVYRLTGPLLRPWTFHIEENGQRTGRIAKKWSGLLKEGFTKSDHFQIDFPDQTSERHKVLLIGAVFLIDFLYFEKRS